MNLSLGWVIFLYSFSLFITLYLFFYAAFRRYIAAGAAQFMLVVLAEATWTFGNICELLTPTLDGKLFWDNMQWPPALLAGVFVLWFALAFTRARPAVIRRTVTAVALICLIVSMIQIVPMVRTGVRPGAHLTSWDSFESLIYPFLPSDYLAIAFQYLLIIAALGHLVRWGMRQPKIYRQQSILILVGLLIPVVGVLFGFVNVWVGPQRDISPVMFAIGNLVVAAGLFRLKLFNMRQAAREKAVEYMRDPLIVLDADDRIEDLNPAAQKLFQSPIGEAKGKFAAEVLPNAIPLARYMPGREYQDEVRLDEAIQAAEPACRTFDLGVLPVFDRLGHLSGRILVMHDITARKRTEEIQRQINEERVLRRSEEKFHTTIEQMGEGFVLVNTSGRVAEWNEAMAEITGISVREARGRQYWEIMELLTLPERRSPERIAFYKQAVLSVIQTGGVSPTYKPPADAEIITSLGVRKTIQQAVFPVRIGEENWIASLSRDITEQKLAQLRLERFATRMQLLHGIDSAILAANSTADLCETALREMQQLVPYRQAGLGLIHLREKSPSWLVQHGPENERGFLDGRLEAWTEAFLANPTLSELETGWINMHVLALRSQEQLIGVLYLLLDDQQIYSAEMEEIARDLSAQLAVALHHASLLEQTQRRVQELTGLHEMALNLNQYMRRAQPFGRLAEKIAGLTGAARAVVILLDDSTGVVRVAPPAHGFTEEETARLVGPLPEFVERSAQWTEDWVHINSLDDSHPLSAWLQSRISYQNVLASPLMFEGRFFGGIVLADKPGDFHPEDIHLLTVVASQTAVVILNVQLFEQLSAAYEATIAGWSKALELRDKETQGHSNRVTELSLSLASRCGVSGEDLQHFKRGVLLHDIGKMSIPDSILLKEGELTEAEWVVMRQHPQRAADMLSNIEYLRPAMTVPYCHHERWNGSGYPQGLIGEAIPLWARLFAVVDVWDALTNDRPYRAAWSKEDTLTYLRKNAGVQFDPHVVNEFIQMLEENPQ